MTSVYWDTGCFFDVLVDGRANTDDARQVWAAARDGPVTIVTSTATIAELGWAQGRYWQELVDAGADQAADAWLNADPTINQFWATSSPVDLVDVTERLAQRAAALVRWCRFGPLHRNLTPVDALHVATAEREELLLQTSDGLEWLADHVDVKIGPPRWDEPQLFTH